MCPHTVVEGNRIAALKTTTHTEERWEIFSHQWYAATLRFCWANIMSPTLVEGMFRGSYYPWAAPRSLILCGSGLHPPGHLPLTLLDESMEVILGFPGGASGKEPTCHCRRRKRLGFDPWVGKIPLEEGMAIHSSILAWRVFREAWQVHSITKSWTRLKWLSMHAWRMLETLPPPKNDQISQPASCTNSLEISQSLLMV